MKTKVWLKRLKILVLCGMGAGVLLFFLSFCAVLYGDRDNIRGTPDVMLILGCEVKPWGPSELLLDRLDEALGYLEENPQLPVIVSGGQGPTEPTSEAQAMADYLIEHGIPEHQILLEDQSTNTAENMVYSYQLWQEQEKDSHVLVVSNGFHLTRAELLAERAGFEEVSTLAAPSSHAPSKLKMYVREPLALVKSILFDR